MVDWRERGRDHPSDETSHNIAYGDFARRGGSSIGSRAEAFSLGHRAQHSECRTSQRLHPFPCELTMCGSRRSATFFGQRQQPKLIDELELQMSLPTAAGPLCFA